MKKILAVLAVLAIENVYSQFNTPWTNTISNATQTGYLGIGTRTTSSSNVLPNFNLHLHGTADFTGPSESINISGISTNSQNGSPDSEFVTKSTVNFGKTVQLGFTNSTTGMLNTDGTVLRMSGNDFSILNRENGLLRIAVPGIGMVVSSTSKRFWINNSAFHTVPTSTSSTEARFNIITSGDNGLYVRNATSGKYGMFVKVASNTDNAIQIQGIGSNTFVVKGSGNTEIFTASTNTTDKILLVQNSSRKLLQLTNDGILRSREIIVDMNNWPDYVFRTDYNLISLDKVESFIIEKGHLPNVPNASSIENEGLSLGEMNRILMEKVEELTLYLIEQNKMNQSQQKKIEDLEQMLNNKN